MIEKIIDIILYKKSFNGNPDTQLHNKINTKIKSLDLKESPGSYSYWFEWNKKRLLFGIAKWDCACWGVCWGVAKKYNFSFSYIKRDVTSLRIFKECMQILSLRCRIKITQVGECKTKWVREGGEDLYKIAIKGKT